MRKLLIVLVLLYGVQASVLAVSIGSTDAAVQEIGDQFKPEKAGFSLTGCCPILAG